MKQKYSDLNNRVGKLKAELLKTSGGERSIDATELKTPSQKDKKDDKGKTNKRTTDDIINQNSNISND